MSGGTVFLGGRFRLPEPFLIPFRVAPLSGRCGPDEDATAVERPTLGNSVAYEFAISETNIDEMRGLTYRVVRGFGFTLAYEGRVGPLTARIRRSRWLVVRAILVASGSRGRGLRKWGI